MAETYYLSHYIECSSVLPVDCGANCVSLSSANISSLVCTASVPTSIQMLFVTNAFFILTQDVWLLEVTDFFYAATATEF